MERSRTVSKQSWARVAIRAGLALQVLLVSAAAASAQVVFDNTNTGGVGNGPTNATVISLRTPTTVREIQTYHWNYGRGSRPGSIALRAQNGQVYGPFAARATSGYQNAPNVNWIAAVNRVLPAGTYTVLDSDPGTWSQNPQSGGRGFAIVRGTAAVRASLPPVNVPRVVPQPAAQNCQVSPVYIRNLRYDDYSRYARLTSTNVPLGGFIQISTSCLRFDGRIVVTLQDTARGNGFGVTAFQLTNVRVSGSTVIAQLPTQALFRNRSFHVAVFVYGNPWKTANAGTVTIR